MCILSDCPTILQQSSARLLIFVFPVAPVSKERKKKHFHNFPKEGKNIAYREIDYSSQKRE